MTSGGTTRAATLPASATSRAWTKLGFGAASGTTSAVSLAGATAAVSALRTGMFIQMFSVGLAWASPPRAAGGLSLRQTSTRLIDRLLR